MAVQIGRDRAILETMQSLRRIFKATQNYSQEIYREFGVTGPQLWALKTISQNKDLSLKELGEAMYLHPSSMTGLIDRLEKRGFALRKRDERDRRVVKIRLTPKGTGLVKKSPNPIQGKLIHGLKNLKRGKLNSIFSSTRKLVEIMEAENVRATFFFDEKQPCGHTHAN